MYTIPRLLKAHIDHMTSSWYPPSYLQHSIRSWVPLSSVPHWPSTFPKRGLYLHHHWQIIRVSWWTPLDRVSAEMFVKKKHFCSLKPVWQNGWALFPIASNIQLTKWTREKEEKKRKIITPRKISIPELTKNLVTSVVFPGPYVHLFFLKKFSEA